MTRSVDIDFTFGEPVDVLLTLRALLEAGMVPSVEGEVTYLIDADGMFDWQKAEVPQLKEIISALGESRWADRVVGMTLLLPEAIRGGEVLFHPGRTSVSYVISVNPKCLPASSRFCDVGWYLANLVPIFEPLGLSEIETRDSP
ncbi:hypothetical protein ACWD1Y_15810 [Streptomyces sp. NPDC002814]